MPVERSVLKSWPLEPVAAVLWEALAQDSAAKVAVIDGEGSVLATNRAFARWFGRGPAMTGRRLEAFLPKSFADERRGLIGRVIRTGKAVRLRSAWRGVRQDEYIRPLPVRVGGREAVLVTIASCEPVVEASGKARTVQAEHLDEGPLASISPRERVVLSLIGAGMPTAEIARKLGRSTKTIENQRLSLGRKLGARNRVELARIAIQSGLAAKVTNKKLTMG